MPTKKAIPTTLQQAIVYFSDYQNCHDFMVGLRWPGGNVACPRCGETNVKYLENARLWKCYAKHAKAKFSLKVGTVFEDSPIGLEKWLVAVWMVVNAKNGISSYEVHRALGVTQKSAWFMLSRIRFALHQGSFDKNLFGVIEADETYVGGLARNMHKRRREANVKGPGGLASGKTPVHALLERSERKNASKIRVAVVENARKKTLQTRVRENVEPGSVIMTDSLLSYEGLDGDYFHGFVNHAEQYVDGAIHTNGVENFWTLLKRTLKATYVSVEPFHLFRYLDEQAFRFNKREGKDADRFRSAMTKIGGKRLTYRELTGKEAESAAVN